MATTGDGKQPELSGDKATRIVDAMRKSIATRGPVGSTFDNVARDAGVSRGLLHYYFGSKERLMIEVIRQETELRIAQIEVAFETITSPQDVLDILLGQLANIINDEPSVYMLGFEMMGEARRNQEIGSVVAEYQRRTRRRLAETLRNKQEQGVINMTVDPLGAASLILALGQGLAMEILSDPEGDHSATLAATQQAGLVLLGG